MTKLRQTHEFHKIDDLEQYGRRLNLEFEGIPEQKEKNVTSFVLNITKKLTIDANFNDNQLLFFVVVAVVVVAHIYPSVTRQRQMLTCWMIRTLFITPTTL